MRRKPRRLLKPVSREEARRLTARRKQIIYNRVDTESKIYEAFIKDIKIKYAQWKRDKNGKKRVKNKS